MYTPLDLAHTRFPTAFFGNMNCSVVLVLIYYISSSFENEAGEWTLGQRAYK